MSITTYDELKTAIASWQHRSNADFTARVPEFIALFEADANAYLRLRENEVEVPLAAIPGSPFMALPADFQEPVMLEETASGRRLVYRPPVLLRYRPWPGRSRHWTVKDSRAQTERDADQAYAYTLRYHRRFTLSADQPTNVLLARFPNAYLYGALIEAAPFVRDLGVVDFWRDRYVAAVLAIRQTELIYKKRGTLVSDAALTAGSR